MQLSEPNSHPAENERVDESLSTLKMTDPTLENHMLVVAKGTKRH